MAESDGINSYDDFDLLEDLRNWTNDYKVTTTAVDALLKIFAQLSSTFATDMSNPNEIKIEQLSGCSTYLWTVHSFWSPKWFAPVQGPVTGIKLICYLLSGEYRWIATV